MNAARRAKIGPRTLPDVIEPVKVTPVADTLNSFDVTTDSVVVTVRLSTSQPARRLFVDWGDDQHDTIWVRPGLPADLHTHPQDDPLPVGTYEFHHAYEPPQGAVPFSRTFLVQVEYPGGGDDLRLKTVRLVPRYRVVQYRTYLDLQDPCDLFDSTSELSIKLSVTGLDTRSWDWEPTSSIYPVSTVLEGSQFAVEMTGESDVNSPDYTGYISVSYQFEESDWGPDQSGSYSDLLSPYSLPTQAEQDVDTEVHVDKAFAGGCTVRLHFDREAQLIRPLPSTGSDWPVFTDS